MQDSVYSLLDTIGELLTWSACWIIPVFIILYLVRRKSREHFRPLCLLTALFIWICGTIYLLDAVAVRLPWYRLHAVARMLAGVTGWTIVLYLFRKKSAMLASPSARELEQEIRIREDSEAALKRKNMKLMEGERIAMLTHAYWDFTADRIEFSEAGYELFGLTPGREMSFQTLLSLVYHEDREYVIGRTMAIRATKIFEPFYFRINLPGRGPRHFLAAGRFPFENRDLLVCTLQDVTQQKDALEQIQSMRLKEIASIQSHQVRGQVATIMGLSDIFNYDDPSDPANARLLKDIRRATQNLDHLIHEIVQKASEPGT